LLRGVVASPQKRGLFLAVGALILGFASIFSLFLMSLAPQGVLDFGPPNGNFTGTTTISTSFGYLCVASHISSAPGGLAGGIGMNCSPEFYGYLQVPLGSEAFAFWLLTFAAFGISAAYLSRKINRKGHQN